MSNSSWLNCTIEEHEEMVENSKDGVEVMKSELEFLRSLFEMYKYDWQVPVKSYDIVTILLDRIEEVEEWEDRRRVKGVEL